MNPSSAATLNRETAVVPPPRTVVPELLAPAGDWECARAAVENGADAIYFGLEKFNARMRAKNFTRADLPSLMEFLHTRGVRGYVTMNTLIFQDELEEAVGVLRDIIVSGVDAAIVQDVGVARLIRSISPDFPIHASTQMTVTSAAGVRFAAELGCNLVVLARECSIKDIERIRADLGGSGSGGVGAATELPLEVFVHGALCVAYSGQCLTSESLGGRSANRGECAQACRMPYDLVVDGVETPTGDRRYLLSPQDLAGLEVLSELVRAGVSSLKIEGRLKSPEYVANITRVYRTALDRLVVPGAEKVRGVDGADRYAMEMAFSRGLYTGWFRGINNQELVHARFGKKRGVLLGRVLSKGRDTAELRLQAPVKAGDGVVFDAGRPEAGEEGGRVLVVEEKGGVGRLLFHRGTVDWARVSVGDLVWKTSDPALDRALRQSYEGEAIRHQRPVSFQVAGREGESLHLLADDGVGHSVRLESEVPLQRAEKSPLDTARLESQLGRLGGTPFRLGSLVNQLDPGLILPVSELNRLRRSAVDALIGLRRRPLRWAMDPAEPRLDAAGVEVVGGSDPGAVLLSAAVRQMDQLEAAISMGIGVVYCEFEDPKRYRDAVAMVRESGRDLEIWVAPPRIHKPGEEWVLKQVLSCEADGYLVRNHDHLEWFRDHRRVGDFSLNIANAPAAAHFMKRYGLQRLTASYDLNARQLVALLRATPPGWLEITLHQHMPMFHMEHCVFCAFLSKGTDYTNCGRPCDRHEVRLRDRVGAQHLLKADAGCRNTLFNSMAQSGAEYLQAFLGAGARRFRIEFLDEPPSTVRRTLDIYRRLVAGKAESAEVWRELKVLNQLGVTRGQL